MRRKEDVITKEEWIKVYFHEKAEYIFTSKLTNREYKLHEVEEIYNDSDTKLCPEWNDWATTWNLGQWEGFTVDAFIEKKRVIGHGYLYVVEIGEGRLTRSCGLVSNTATFYSEDLDEAYYSSKEEAYQAFVEYHKQYLDGE